MPAEHILTYARNLSGGGVERAMLRLADGWLTQGRRVTLVVGDATGPLAAEVPDGLECIDLGTSSRRALFGLPAIIRERRPDILFCAGNYYSSVAAWTKLRLGSGTPPIVAKMSNAVVHGDHGMLMGTAHRGWLALHGRFLDHLVAMTPATASSAAAALRMRGRTSVIPNPPAWPIAEAQAMSLPPGRIVLGVGRLVAQKRWDRLIAALPALPADVALVILGDGDQRRALERQIAALGLRGRVHLPGHATDPLPPMARATMLALTSDYEGVPGVLREALSVGTPVVSTASSESIAEIVADDSLGSVVGRDDAAGLVAALCHWLDAPRPAPVLPPGADAATLYLALFDRLA